MERLLQMAQADVLSRESLPKGLKLFSLAPPMFPLTQQRIGSLVEYETGWFVIRVLNAKHNGLSDQMPFYPR